MNPIEILKTILREIDNNKNLYVANPQKILLATAK